MDAQDRSDSCRCSRSSAPTPTSLIVLLAEDDPNDLVLAERAFRRLRRWTRLLTVTSGEEAIVYLLGEGSYADRRVYPMPQALVLDHRMPQLCGLSVLSWLRCDPRFVSMPVLIQSLGLMPSEADAVVRLNAAWRRKPMEADGMVAMLEEGIREAFRRVGKPLDSSFFSARALTSAGRIQPPAAPLPG